MPFQSKAQQRFMFAKHPKIAKEFAKETDFSSLPEKKSDDSTRKYAEMRKGKKK